ncbi:MAG TPA: response regulator [Terracidiphilus sp.]|nr:response regulator [Terracidiphilus sp.]
MTDRILFVDDDKQTLDAYKRLMHGKFNVETAASGTQAIAVIHLLGPFAVVVSDMRMPEMNGAEFLARVREIAPHSVRMLLTGHKDLDRAIEAVNEGQIFRYLTKPCKQDALENAILLGLARYRSNVENGDLIKEAKHHRFEAAANCHSEPSPTK